MNKNSRTKSSPVFSKLWKFAAAVFPIIGILRAGPVVAQTPAICGTNELVHLGRALAAMNMTTNDLNFDKDHGEPRVCLPWIREALNHPLMLPQEGDELLRATTNTSTAIWRSALKLLDVRTTIARSVLFKHNRITAYNSEIDPSLFTDLKFFAESAGIDGLFLNMAFTNLNIEEKGWLTAMSYSELFRVNRSDVIAALQTSGVNTTVIERAIIDEDAFDPDPATTRYLALAAKINRTTLFDAATGFQNNVRQLIDKLRAATNWPTNRVTIETDLGPIIILPPGDNVVTNRALLVIDRGGNTTYLENPGAANGLLGQPLSAIIDLGGNDRYLGGDGVGPGGALFGVSVIYDMAGDDEYKAHYLGEGAAMFGASWLEDKAGDDRYDAWALAQGAAIGGFAVLRDGGGNDIYNLGLCGQGFAGFQGVGFLIDDAGDDRYLAGNREHDWDRNSGRYLSLAQGFSIGIRGFAGGGVGALIDRAGNDTYAGDVYAQGVSYWYSAGFLIDVAGHDNYTMYQYGQGTGIHLSLGLLADFEGNDRYTGYILSQGSGHDFGVGMLFDHAGDDTYTADHHSQGRALNVSLGLLVDSAGDDGYFVRQNDRAQGIGNFGGTRECGSLALLLDLDGRDQFSSGAKNDDILLRPLYGIIYDHSTNAPATKAGAR